MFMTQLWAVQSYPIEKEVLGVTLDTSEDLAINYDLDHDLHLEFSRSNIKFAVYIWNDGPNAMKRKKKTCQRNPRPQVWPFILV